MLELLRPALHPAQRDDPLFPELVAGLQGLITAPDIGARLDAWIALHDWLRLPQAASDEGESHRLRLMLHALEVCEPVRVQVQQAVGALFTEADATGLLAETGMPSDRGFFAETSERFWAKLLPEPREPANLDQFVRRCFRTEEHVARFARIGEPLIARFAANALPPIDAPAWAGTRISFANAIRLLCARVAGQGLAAKLRARSPEIPVAESPFHRLPLCAERVLAAVAAGEAAPVREFTAAIAACRQGMAEIHHQVGDEGVSVDIVYGLEVLSRCLARLELLVAVIAASDAVQRVGAIHRLLSHVIAQAHRSRSLREVAGTNLRRLHQRIVERSGETGEHYIARDRHEYRHLFVAALGGGVLTVGTAAMKIVVSGTHGSDFLHGMLYGLNYAVSFLILHHCHLVLATKQPAMTAAHLATIMRGNESDRLDQIVDRIARITHSQLAAAAGNILAVGLGALAFSHLWLLTTGHTFMDPAKALETYDTLGPLTSGTVFYAALTGVILWASSLVGGWLDNWSAYHRIPQGIADHHLGSRFGRDRLMAWAATWKQNLAGWGANISLGFMLGMTPAIGHFFGVPLDVRHVTLSTGMLFTACGSLGTEWWSGGWFLNALFGIAVMFVLNLGVSFALSLGTAVRALEVPKSDQLELLRRLLVRLTTRPGDFILPPRTALKGETL